MKVMGVFCISCSSILVCAGKEGEGEPAPQVITLQMALREINGILNGERNEEEGGESAPEAIADPLRLVLWGTDDVKWVLNMGVVGILCFAEVFVRQLIRNERFGIPPEGRVLIEETWDHCLGNFVTARKSLLECVAKLDAVVALAQAVREVINGGPDHVAEAQQDYLELHEAYRRQHGASLRQMCRELGFVSDGEE